jgi:hypothetical protein
MIRSNSGINFKWGTGAGATQFSKQLNRDQAKANAANT